MAARLLRTALLLLAAMACASAARADRLELIRARGVLVVGVKTEYPPFGMLDGSGAIVGVEPDLAADLARRLHVDLRLVGVTTANRLEKLADGSIDVLIATLGDTAKRRKIATLIEPDYYASGVTIMMPAKRKIADWTELRGQTVCTTQGAYFNRPMAQRYLLDLRTFNGPRDAMLALRQGQCVGFLYDDTAIAGALRLPEWHDYAMPLPSLLVSPWAIAIPQGENDGPLDRIVSDAVADWHRSGLLMALERKWQLKPSEFVRHAHALWSARDADGDYTCRRSADGAWPAACGEQEHAASDHPDGLERLGAEIRDLTGLDFTIVYDAYDRGQFLHGLMTALALVLSCVFGSVLLGGIGALALDARIPLVSPLAGAVATVARMTPPLLQIYIVVFGLGSILVKWGLALAPFLAVTICLSLYAGSACAVALAEAAELIRHRQPEFRLRPASLPLALRAAYQPVMAALVNIVKATGMASAVAVPELISSSTAIMAERGNSSVMMNVLMVVYFLIVLVTIWLFNRFHHWITAHVAP
ncbi:MAG TPA: transporter substrate-binding domain-containing protein [Stellaceae bacterium]|nr:transporter substrate-binding domain-containing protein [Stellaceae bacterium]